MRATQQALLRIFSFLKNKPAVQIGGVLLLGLLIRLIWVAYTRYTAEDAFITFKFAQRLAQGHGFVYNIGQPIYGTTTPLFALLMAGWFWTGWGNITLAAHAVDLLSALASLIILYLILRRMDVAHPAQLILLGILAISSKMYSIEMQGMETPVVILLMMASWYAMVTDRPYWAGFFAGWLLWTRIDLVFWPLALILVEALFNYKVSLRIALATAITYLPWVIFATLYFGSAVPFTIEAKWVAYVLPGLPLQTQLTTVINYLSPFSFDTIATPEPLLLFAGCATLGIAIWQVVRLGRDRSFLVLSVFACLETVRLVLSGATFFNRYLFPLLWVVLILFGLGLVSLWQVLSRKWQVPAWIPGCLLAAGLILILWQAVDRSNLSRTEQTDLNEASTQMVGIWLNRNSSPDASVLLEPLGYAGFYADRKMYDVIGLVTPQVVDLRLQGLDPQDFFRILRPDYVVQHCDDDLRLENERADQGTRFVDLYHKVAGFNPLDFQPAAPAEISSDISVIPRNACYDIWQRIGP